MAQILTERLLSSGHIAWVAMSEVADGDMSIGNYQARQKSIHEASASLRRSNREVFVPPSHNWSFLNQVHGIEVIEDSGDHIAEGTSGDAIVTTLEKRVITVQVADCVPIALISENGAIGVVHAGWRGLLGGVLEETSTKLRATKPGKQMAVVGPHIGPCCYEFGKKELSLFIDEYGRSAAGLTKGGLNSLDLSSVVERICDEKEIEIIKQSDSCTFCDVKYWSYRSNETENRQCLFVWIEKK